MHSPGKRLEKAILCTSILLLSALGGSDHSSTAQAATDTATKIPVSKAISIKSLEGSKKVSITATHKGKESKYKGVPLREILAQMMPEQDLDTMPGWKELNRKELVIELRGDDGYPGLVPAVDVAINKTGDRFILATEEDGKPIDSGVLLVCKTDEAPTRWVRGVVSIRIVQIPKQ